VFIDFKASWLNPQLIFADLDSAKISLEHLSFM